MDYPHPDEEFPRSAYTFLWNLGTLQGVRNAPSDRLIDFSSPTHLPPKWLNSGNAITRVESLLVNESTDSPAHAIQIVRFPERAPAQGSLCPVGPLGPPPGLGLQGIGGFKVS